MKDWKGNIICVGQTVLIVSTNTYGAGDTMFLMWPQPDGTFKKSNETRIPDQHQWKITDRFLITEPGNTVFYSNDDTPNKVPINLVDWNITKRFGMHEIVCIEGISDNQLEYFKEFFNK